MHHNGREIPRGSRRNSEANLKLYYHHTTWQTSRKAELAATWRHVVEDYTKLLLTDEMDIFPAMSGLAKQFQETVQSQYLAGLWRNDFLSGLLWHFEDALPACPRIREERCRSWLTRPKIWRAPSLSWASVKAPVLFLRNIDKFQPGCKLLDVDCELASSDLTGVLVNGKNHFVLCGRLAPATINVSTRDALKRHKNTNNLTLDKVRRHPHFCRLWTDYDWDDIL